MDFKFGKWPIIKPSEPPRYVHAELTGAWLARAFKPTSVPKGEKTMTMTPEQFLEFVKGFQGGGDPEIAHSEIDEVMEQILTDLGYGEGIEALQDVTRWYA
jgi:hypothetical protein